MSLDPNFGFGALVVLAIVAIVVGKPATISRVTKLIQALVTIVAKFLP